MIRKPVSDLAFVRSQSPLPTVEVDSDSIESAGFSIYRTVMQVLTRLAEQDAALRATLYLHVSDSVNFGKRGLSEFLLVAGPKKVLQALEDAFEVLPSVKSRRSDEVSPSIALQMYHVEDGLVWEPEDADAWCSIGQSLTELTEGAEAAEKIEDDPQPLEDESEDEYEEEWEEDDGEQSEVASGRNAARYRAARSDAKVSSIRATIESVFGLPAGSVALCGPDRRALRGDARIRTLRKRWEES